MRAFSMLPCSKCHEILSSTTTFFPLTQFVKLRRTILPMGRRANYEPVSQQPTTACRDGCPKSKVRCTPHLKPTQHACFPKNQNEKENMRSNRLAPDENSLSDRGYWPPFRAVKSIGLSDLTKLGLSNQL